MRYAQTTLAAAVTRQVHGDEAARLAENITAFLTGKDSVSQASDAELSILRSEIPTVKVTANDSIISALQLSGLAQSNSDARRLLESNAVTINGEKVARPTFEAEDFQNNRLLLRRGKAFKDSALIELG